MPAIFLFCILLLGACTPSERMDGYVYFRLYANPSTLDPALIVDVNSSEIAAKLFNGLVKLDAQMRIDGDIAERWTVSNDGRRYCFYLRRDVTFSDGRPLMAADVLYSFERVLAPQTRSPNTWIFQYVKGAQEFQNGQASIVSGFRVINNHTFEITLRQPFSPFLSLLTMPPAFIVQREAVQRAGAGFGYQPVGTGPFTLARWLPDREIVLQKAHQYFAEPAKISGMVYRIIPEDLTAVAEFELGNLDMIVTPASAYKRFRDNPQWRDHIVERRGLNTYYLGLNCARQPFHDVRMRRAVFQAIDREKILRTFYEGRGRLAAGPIADVLRSWRPAAAYPFDPDAAKNFVRMTGNEGTTVSLYVTTDQEMIDIAEIIQDALKNIGLHVSIKQLEWSAYKEAINRGEADLFWLSWWADYPDAENFLFPLFHSANDGYRGNRTRYRNPEVDRLITTGQRSVTEKDRTLAYSRAEQLIVEDVPWVFFWHKNDYFVIQPRLHGIRPWPIHSMDKGTDMYLTEAGVP
jgi:peptide/nickel transport system substrate-binding protein/oligopeptide transport system substrate-binding protein